MWLSGDGTLEKFDFLASKSHIYAAGCLTECESDFKKKLWKMDFQDCFCNAIQLKNMDIF